MLGNRLHCRLTLLKLMSGVKGVKEQRVQESIPKTMPDLGFGFIHPAVRPRKGVMTP